jgi:hypothetical protein
MIITGDDPEYIAFVKARLRDQFLMTDRGPLCYFLGIEVSSTFDGFSISQEKYIQDLLARLSMLGAIQGRRNMLATCFLWQRRGGQEGYERNTQSIPVISFIQ